VLATIPDSEFPFREGHLMTTISIRSGGAYDGLNTVQWHDGSYSGQPIMGRDFHVALIQESLERPKFSSRGFDGPLTGISQRLA
jgi:hypothetical protein